MQSERRLRNAKATYKNGNLSSSETGRWEIEGGKVVLHLTDSASDEAVFLCSSVYDTNTNYLSETNKSIDCKG